MTKCLFENFWFMLACLDLSKCFAMTLYFAIYDFMHMLKYDEIFCNFFWFRNLWSCLHARDLNFRMFQFERNVSTIEFIFRFRFAISFITCSNSLWSCLHVKIVFDVQWIWIISLVWLNHIYIEMFFYQNVRSEIVCKNDVFFL